MKPEPVTLREMQLVNKKVAPACPHCGSADIRVEAFARWSEQLQDWRLSELLDGNSCCNHCGQDCEVKWRLS